MSVIQVQSSDGSFNRIPIITGVDSAKQIISSVEGEIYRFSVVRELAYRRLMADNLKTSG
jgi:hypothetical protein